MSNILFSYSCTCGICGEKITKQAPHNWDANNAMRAEGWVIPEAIENKPITCPKHKMTE